MSTLQVVAKGVECDVERAARIAVHFSKELGPPRDNASRI